MNIQRFAAVLLVLVGSGCSVVTIDEPAGDLLTAEQKEQYSGVWVSQQDEPSTVEFRVAKDGRLISGNLQWDEEQQAFKVETQVLEPRQLAGQTYLYYQSEKREKHYLFARVELQPEGKMMIYPPEPDRFREAIESGALPGRVEVTDEEKKHFTVHIKGQSKATHEFLASPDWRKYYMKEPLLLRKLQAVLAPANGPAKDGQNPDSPKPAGAPAP